MNSQDNGEDVADTLRGDTIDAYNLSADSYTAQRLKHASAKHLHLTTRRIFIGPIPVDWIASHRKSWTKYRPRMLTTYSTKTATFNAANTVSEFRTLTGLDSNDERVPPQGISFPQPADVNDDEPVVPSIDNEDASRAAVDGQPGAAARTRSNTSTRLEPEGAPTPVPLTPTTTKESNREGSFVTAPTKPADGKTFVTAREGIDGLDGDFDSQKKNNPDDHSLSFRLSVTEPDSPQRNSDSAARPKNGLRKKVSSESTQALLPAHQRSIERNNGEANGSTRQRQTTKSSARSASLGATLKKTPSKQVLLEVAPEAYEDDDARNAGIIQAEPVHTGMVRFELPDQMASRGGRIRGRIAEAKERVITQDFRKAKAEPGQLLKAERMLVRIEFTKHELENSYAERDSAKAETVVIEKWREYMVTCRKSNKADDGFILYMAKTRVIPMLANERTSKKSSHAVNLYPNVTKVNLFSPLDKTIVLWEPKRKGTKICILRARSPACAIEWFTFLNLLIGWRSPTTLRISVPDLDVVVEMENPLNQSDVLRETSADDDLEDSDRHQHTKLTDGHVAKHIVGKALELLRNSEFQDVVDAWAERDERLGLVWRQYDRLEWIHGANEERMYGALAMQKTHELELRTKMHYPTSVIQIMAGAENNHLEEPAPIEGFLVRQTSQKGRDTLLGRNFFKRLYFSTHNHLLCFSTPGKAVPPKPSNLSDLLEDGSNNAKTLASSIPLIYKVDPYPIKNGKISWLGEQNSTKKKQYDQNAYAESERAIHLLLEAEGYIDLCHIKKVRKYKPKKDGLLPEPQAGQEQHEEDSDSGEESESAAASTRHDIQRSFELHLHNGLVIKLQAYDKVARKEWVKRLRGLSAYWKLRTAGDIGLYKEVRQQNLDNLGIDEEMESMVGQVAEKWEVSKSVASPELFHMCGISCCRQINMSGSLYRKPRLHSSFKKCVVVLCHGKLLVFQATLRSSSGHEQPHILHQREEVIDLKDSYVYSGSLTEDDLLYQNKTFDSNHPGHNALPRVFRDDNWSSIDEDPTTCFVVWRSRRKSFFKANTEKDDGGIGSQLRYVSSLGVPGRSMVFKTRSRAERDHWVTNIGMEIERLQQAEDVRIVVSK